MVYLSGLDYTTLIPIMNNSFKTQSTRTNKSLYTPYLKGGQFQNMFSNYVLELTENLEHQQQAIIISFFQHVLKICDPYLQNIRQLIQNINLQTFISTKNLTNINMSPFNETR